MCQAVSFAMLCQQALTNMIQSSTSVNQETVSPPAGHYQLERTGNPLHALFIPFMRHCAADSMHAPPLSWA